MSTFNTTNIESTSGGAPNFSQGLNVGGSSITSIITMTEYYSQAEEPTSPANGAVWWDGTDAYQYVGGAWRILSVTAPPVLALFGGGLSPNFNVIDYVTVATPSNAVDFGDLTLARHSLAACSDNTYGLFGGGSTGAASNVIDYVTVATPSNATDFGDLTLARNSLAACADNTYGLFGGGVGSNVIDYIVIATPGNAIDFGDLTVSRVSGAACSDGTYGVFAGGGGLGSQLITIDYVTIAAPGNAADFGDLTIRRNEFAACANSYRGLFGGGYTGTLFGGPTNSIDYITIAAPGNATDFGDLTLARSGLGGCSGGTYGLFGGGANTIDRVNIDTTGNAADFGDLTVSRSYLAACSGN